MYKFHNGLKQENSENSTPDIIVEQHRHFSTSSSFDKDTVLEDSFEMWASLAPEALISASLTKRWTPSISQVVYICASNSEV